MGHAVADNAGTWGSPATISPAGLASISCATATFCVAVDWNGNAITYSGGSWGSPVYIDSDPDGLSSVSCPTSTFCVAVDDEGQAVTYSSGSWGSPHEVDPAGAFTSISCASAASCVAVDGEGEALTYSSGSWSAPDLIDTVNYDLDSVSCASATYCAASNQYGYTFTDSAGTWTAHNTASGDELASISCPTTSFCVAVDYANTAYTGAGSAWSSTSIDTSTFGLAAVSCSSAASCVAIDSDGYAVTYSFPVPVDSTLPSITGTAQQSSTLTAAHGTWTNTPTSYTYQWQHCSGTCTNITGATSSTYTLTSGDVGDTIQVTVTATNAGGSTNATSTRTATITAPAPPTTPAPATPAPPTTTETTTPTTTTTTPLAVVSRTPAAHAGVDVAISLPGPGTVTAAPQTAAAQSMIGTLTVGTTPTGATVVRITPSPAAAQQLRAGHRVTVTVLIVFHPTSGASSTIPATVTLQPEAPSNLVTASHITVGAGGVVHFTLKVAGRGKAEIMETAWDSAEVSPYITLLQPARHRFVFARARMRLTKSGTIRVTVTPNAAGTRLVADHHGDPLRIRLWVTFVPAGGVPRSVGFYCLPVPASTR